MIDAVIYDSHTGFTKQYAYRIAVTAGIPVYSLKESKKLKPGLSIVYMSWVRDGKIWHLQSVKGFHIIYTIAVGMVPYSEEYMEELKKDNALDFFFYLEGGLRYYKLTMPERMHMNHIRKYLEKKKKREDVSLNEAILLDKLTLGSENVDFDVLGVVMKWIMEEKDNIVC